MKIKLLLLVLGVFALSACAIVDGNLLTHKFERDESERGSPKSQAFAYGECMESLVVLVVEQGAVSLQVLSPGKREILLYMGDYAECLFDLAEALSASGSEGIRLPYGWVVKLEGEPYSPYGTSHPSRGESRVAIFLADRASIGLNTIIIHGKSS